MWTLLTQIVVSSNSRACFTFADVSDRDSLITALTLGVVYDAGINSFDNLLEEELDDAGRLKAPTPGNIETNLHGPLLTTKAAVHFFQKQGGQRKYQLVITGSAARYVVCRQTVDPNT